jgi:hypothetical protein
MSTGARVIEEKDIRLFKRVWHVVMGRIKPPLLTRILLLAALVSFIYYFCWNAFRYFALTFIELLDNPEDIKASLQHIGDRNGISDALNSFSMFYLVMMLNQLLVLAGMILIYRRMVAGYAMFIAGQAITFLSPLVLLNMDYFVDEIDIVDKVGPVILAVAFLFSMMRLKHIRNMERRERVIRQQL